MTDKPWVEIADHLDCLAFYRSEGIDLRQTGSGFKGKCPFHNDDKPSMSVSTRGLFNCKACGAKGSVFDFYAQRHNVGFREAMEAVAHYAPGFDPATLKQPRGPHKAVFDPSVIDQWATALAQNEQVIAYLENRGITREAIATYRLGWTGDRIAIPIRDADGKYINAKLYKVGGDSGNKMVWAVSGFSAPLYIPKSDMNAAGVLLVEGEFDCIVARIQGFNANTGTAGARTWKKEWSDALRGLVVYILFDHDDAGRLGSKAAAAALHDVGCEVHIASWPDETPDGFDLTDWFTRAGKSAEELRALLDLAVPYVPAEHAAQNGHGKAKVEAAAVEALPLKRLSDVEREDVTWLWHPYIPKGKLSLLVGNPGVGKSFLTCAITGAVTQGWTLPGTDAPLDRASVILLAAEDGPADTLRPRLEDMGVLDLTTVMVLPPEEDFSLLRDMQRLEKEIVERKPALVIIDPLTAYFGGKTDMYRDNEVRATLGPLTQVAAEHGTAIIGVMHLTKGSRDVLLHKVLGSVGFTGLARSVLAIAPDPQNPERKIIAPLKSNLAREGQPRAFSIEEGKFMWLADEVDIDLETLFAPKVPGQVAKPDTALASAIEFIKESLANGEAMPSVQLIEEGKKQGISERTMKRAKQNLPQVRARKKDGVWVWSMEATRPVQLHVVTDDDDPHWNRD